MNLPRDDVFFLWDHLTRAKSILQEFFFPSLRYMSVSSFLIPEVSELFNLIHKSLYSETPYTFLDTSLSCRLSFKKTTTALLTAVSLPRSFQFLLAVSCAAGSVCLSNDDALQDLFSFCFIWKVCVNFLLLWVLVFLLTRHNLNSCANPGKPGVPCPMSLSSL